MAVEETKISAELSKSLLTLQKDILSQGIVISKFTDSQCSTHEPVTADNNQPLLRVRLAIDDNDKALRLTGKDCEALVNNISTYLEGMGTTYLAVPVWQWQTERDKKGALLPTEFATALFKKIAELKKLETLDTSAQAKPHSFDPLLYSLVHSSFTGLKIHCCFHGSKAEMQESEQTLFAAILKSKITTLQVSGRVNFPEIFIQAIKDSKQITRLDVRDLAYTMNHMMFADREDADCVAQFDALANALNASTMQVHFPEKDWATDECTRRLTFSTLSRTYASGAPYNPAITKMVSKWRA